jgi:cysteine desulfurase/selenocysteine lyase
VINALVEYYSADNANPARVRTLATRAAERLAAARQTVAGFVNAADPSEIVFVRGTTEGINLVAATWGAVNLRRGDDIVLTVAEHSSNLMPWTRLARRAGANVRVLGVDDEGRPDLDQLKKVLSKRTRVLAFSHVSNVLGFVNPARESVRWPDRSARAPSSTARKARRTSGSTCRTSAATSTSSPATRCSARWPRAWSGAGAIS